RQIGLVDDDRFARFSARQEAVTNATELLRSNRIAGAIAADWLRRTENDWTKLRERLPAACEIAEDVARLVEIQVKYEGYIARQDQQIQRFAKLESKLIPTNIDY